MHSDFDCAQRVSKDYKGLYHVYSGGAIAYSRSICKLGFKIVLLYCGVCNVSYAGIDRKFLRILG